MPARPPLLPRTTPTAADVSSRAVGAVLDRLDSEGIECHSLMVVRRGHVVAEGWWAPYSADQPHLLYSLTKTFTATAVGFAVGDGLLSLDDRVVDVLPDHVPDSASEQARRLTVRHLLTMTAGHDVDTLEEAWAREPGDLVRGFLQAPTAVSEGTRHTYDNATTFVLARMVERATGLGLPELLQERLLGPWGVEDAEWDRVASGAAFGFHGLHLRTETVAAFGELLRRGGEHNGGPLLPPGWAETATRRHVASRHHSPGSEGPDFHAGYGYQTWRHRHGFHGYGAFGQHCVVVPEHELVVAVTGAQTEVRHAQDLLDALWDCLLPGIGRPDGAQHDEELAARLRALELPPPHGAGGPERCATATLDAAPDGTALPAGTEVTIEPAAGGWLLRLGRGLDVAAGHGAWTESAPLGRPVVAAGAWQGTTFLADVVVVTSPHRVRLTVDADRGTATAVWTTRPLTSPDLLLHLRAPLMTRPDVT